MSAKLDIAKQLAKYDRVALMLQGGGALGSYQVGVYQALAEANCLPSWICGVSIGAINGAIIAGNAPDKRLAKLQEFWSLVTSREVMPAFSGLMTMMMGQPGFFQPNVVSPWFAMQGSQAATSYYDTSELHKTLDKLIDFGRLNSGEVRLSVGAVNVGTGDNVFFDTEKERLSAEHIMASGALPPALPMVKIGDDYFWDGGIVSNTPLQYLLDEEDDKSQLVFQVELFKAAGAIPQTMQQVETRQKDITYSSRTRQATHGFQHALRLRSKLAEAYKRIPAAKLSAAEKKLMHDYSDAGVVNLIQMIYQSKPDESGNKDYEFSKSTMEAHVAAGYADAQQTLAHSDWLDKPTAAQGVAFHRLHID
jgi:NTE family protein